MTTPSSSSSEGASRQLSEADFFAYPGLNPKAEEKKGKKDWVKIASIVAAVVGALIVGAAVLSIMGYLPLDLLGGPIGCAVTLIVGAAILAPAAYVFYDRWQNPPEEPSR